MLQLSSPRIHEAPKHYSAELLVLVGEVALHDVEADAVSVGVVGVDVEGEALVEDEDVRGSRIPIHRGRGERGFDSLHHRCPFRLYRSIVLSIGNGGQKDCR